MNNEKMLLALETATDVCSVVFKNREGQVFEKRSEKKGTHSENLFIFIDELMKNHSFSIKDLDAVLVSEGPGSYTGLRIAAGGVKGLLFDSDIPLYGVNTLASFARAAANEISEIAAIHSILDARRKHLYHQQFRVDEPLKAESEVQIVPIKDFENRVGKNEIIIGTGLNRVADEVTAKARVFKTQYVTAKSLISLYNSGGKNFINKINPADFEPKYYTSSQVS